MRIVGGQFRGRTLTAFGNTNDIRPTSDKVRGAIFNMLDARGYVQGAYALDAFSGTGALGLEALSRGAQECLFWDKSPQSLKITKANIADLGLEEQAAAQVLDAQKCAKRLDPMPLRDLIFLDPPYNRGLVPLTIEALQMQNWIADEAVFVIETSKSESPDLPGLETLQEKFYGDTRVLIARYI